MYGGGGPPPNFRPPPGFSPPPGAGNYSPRQNEQPSGPGPTGYQGYNPNNHNPNYNQPPMNRYPPRGGHHAGLGSGSNSNGYNQHQGYGGPPAGLGGGLDQFVAQQQPVSYERFKLFVGKIAEMSEGWLSKVLEVAGPVLSITRPAPSMAFVEYGEPEAVLRALEVLNGSTITYPSGKSDSLLLKADDKVRARLDEYEKTRIKDEAKADLLKQAKEDLQSIIERLQKGELPTAARAPLDSNDPEDDGIPAHLRDLAPEDLPEHQRAAITSEIALFRDVAFKKAAEQKAAKLKREQDAVTQRVLAERQRQQTSSHSSIPTGPGRSNSTGTSATASTSTSGAGGKATGPPSEDPQSYAKPVSFVSEGTDFDDAQKERERAERAYKEAEALFNHHERRFEARERTRVMNYERERARERAEEEREERDREAMLDRLARWDDDLEADKGREAFYSDRSRWRAQRRPQRLREQEADEMDRQKEKDRMEAAAKQGDAFLDQLGLLPPPVGGDLKLKIGATIPKVAPKPVKAPTSGVLGLGDDEDDDSKKKRTLIPLVYDDEESNTNGGASLEEIQAKIPSSKDELFKWPVHWSGLSEALITKELSPFTTRMIVESLGTEEDELLSAVMTHIRRHASPQALVEELEPVLDEETTDFVVKIWTELILRTELSKSKA